MTQSRQKRRVLAGSLTLTALLCGGVLGSLVVWRLYGRQMQDPEFLRKQLATLEPSDDEPQSEQSKVRVATARRKPIQPERPIVGRLVEVRKVTVASEVTGTITAMPVEEGTPVVGGKPAEDGAPVQGDKPVEGESTLLAQVDDVWPRLALERCKAKVDSTEAKLKYERPDLARYEELWQDDAISESELEAKRATVKELEAVLAETEAAVKEETTRLKRSKIRAPFDGVVVAKHVELGGHVSPGDPIVDIVSRGEVDALLMVPESAINLVEVRQELRIDVDPLAEQVRGEVVSITPYGPGASRTFPVRVRLDDQNGRLKVGMSVTAMIPTEKEHKALVVSKDAVLVRPDGSTVWVARRAGGAETAKVQPVPVDITARTRDEYAVEPQTAAGNQLLADGSEVVVEGAERLLPGQDVQIVTLNVKVPGVAESRPAEPATPPADPAKTTTGPANRQES